MFKLVEEARAWCPVTWPAVAEDGSVVENRIEVQFRLLDTDANAALAAEGRKVDELVAGLVARLASGEKVAEGQVPSQIWADYVVRFATDWRLVGAANGDPLPFEPANLVRLLKVNGVFEAIVRAYLLCCKGRAEARAGN